MLESARFAWRTPRLQEPSAQILTHPQQSLSVNVNGTPYRTIWLEGNQVKFIHQPLIPHKFEIRSLATYQETATAIEEILFHQRPCIN